MLTVKQQKQSHHITSSHVIGYQDRSTVMTMTWHSERNGHHHKNRLDTYLPYLPYYPQLTPTLIFSNMYKYTPQYSRP